MIQEKTLSAEELESLRGAAEIGDPESMFFLAKAYEAGLLADPDGKARDFWLQKFLASDTVSALLGEMDAEQGAERFSGCPKTEDWHAARTRELAELIREAEACLAKA